MSYLSRLSKALPRKQDPQVVSWEDNRYGIQEMAIDEHYGLGVINEGQAIATMKNVKVRPNEFVLPARAVFNLNESGSSLCLGCDLFSVISGIQSLGSRPCRVLCHPPKTCFH